MRRFNKLYYLKIEIEEIKKDIESITELSSPQMTGMPHSGTTSNPTEQYFMKKEKLVNRLNRCLEKYVYEFNKTINFIEEIEDDETRVIARLRLIQNLKWEEIGRKINLDRSVCYRKLNKALKEKI